ncbi:hypothetical protein WMO40_20805 [Bacillaceae bacterium CLA-AA-H227]|uniref:N-acetyltransferase domain-containing protein n=2 Tax=Robertmurraya TaxID=2837507 RepID=A0A4U1D294_9BACI|nr:hypothetical protein [Robertmurraya kyonggiensis]TKC15196.1 hypothetical protein FA727_20150 [Robertmurraya kyonggiensis]
MNLTDIEHKGYKLLFKIPKFISNLKINSPKIRSFLATSLCKNKSEKIYLNWILNKTSSQFFLKSMSYDGIITLVKHDFNSWVGLRFCDNLTPTTRRIFNGKYVHAVEVVYLHSYKKGEGSNILRELDNLMIQLEIPLVLYAEKEKLVGYYENRGFVNYGIDGNKKNYLMIKFPL